MKKIIIHTADEDFTLEMLSAVSRCLVQFNEDVKNETYGKEWSSCGYTTKKGLGLDISILETGTRIIYINKLPVEVGHEG